MKIYLARPISGLDYDDIVQYYELAKIDLCQYEILCPMVCKGYLKNQKNLATSGITLAPPSGDHAIFERDRWMIGLADVLFADLVGANRVSIGCVMEMAWGSMLGKHVVTAMEKGNPHWHSFVLEATDVLYESHVEAVKYLQKLVRGEW